NTKSTSTGPLRSPFKMNFGPLTTRSALGVTRSMGRTSNWSMSPSAFIEYPTLLWRVHRR
ncbi:hypothetical protein N9I09_02820, partial [Pontimonas sp.]